MLLRKALLLVCIGVCVCEECLRWHCPCVGDTSLKSLKIKRQNPHAVIHQTAQLTKTKTKNLLERIMNERFRNNNHHVNSLLECITSRDVDCLEMYFSPECRVDQVPQWDQIDRISARQTSLEHFVRDAHQLMTKLASYVEQARLDEDERVFDSTKSLAADIKRIEDEGVYELMCNLQMTASYHDVSWDPSIARGVMLLGCRDFRNQWQADNRNFMVFYTLERLLNKIGHQAMMRSRRTTTFLPSSRNFKVAKQQDNQEIDDQENLDKSSMEKNVAGSYYDDSDEWGFNGLFSKRANYTVPIRRAQMLKGN